MNSNSRYNHDDCDFEKEKKECRRCEKEEKECRRCEKEEKECRCCEREEKECMREKRECPTIIKCSTPGAVTIPTGTIVGTTFAPTSLTLNTCGLKSPCAKIEFTSNVVATDFRGSLTFQIFKQCSNQFVPVPVGPSFTFSRGTAMTESDTFTFFICDCDSCFNDCCTYTVVVTVNTVTSGVLAINNATLGAVATCNSNNCCF